MMKRLIPLALAIVVAASCQTRQTDSTAADPAISGALAQVSIDSVRSYIDDLVAFNTRHTLSTQTDPDRGLGAAVGYLERKCGRWAQNAAPGRPQQ